MKFTYRSGQRPLDGFTIKRGVGQGGFGEVYFAVSDAGKEVALKLLHRSPDAELRGIAHCLNLKHPNLVHLYDLRTDEHGAKWVVMEYVFGESLAQWINRYPTGLPTELVREWFGAIARGVSYLHEQGVVHRDLKPGNVFVEHGQLKIGDYGLSRRISMSQGGELTQGVGTPYYMAPEIKSGNYTQSVDIYALGVMLYEMLTGHPPFAGETALEVMMKHMTDQPDLSKVPAEFGVVIERALDKNPVTRFATVREFLRALEAGGIAPPAPTVAAAPVLASPRPPDPAPIPRPRAVPVGLAASLPSPGAKYASGPIPRGFRERLTQLAGSFVVIPIVAALCTAPWALFGSVESWSLLGRLLLLSTAMSWAVLAVARPPRNGSANTWGRRFHLLLVGLAVGALAFWLDGWVVPRGGTATDTSRDLVVGNWARVQPETFSTMMRYLFYYGLAAAACPWWAMTDRKRRERFRFSRVVVAGFAGSMLLFLWPWESASAALGVAPIVIAAVCVQVASPWSQPVLTAARVVARPVNARRQQPRYAV
jgi:hypothetical protein